MNTNFKHQIGGIAMLAGTAIGSGMISLPIALSQIGIAPTILLLIFCFIITYYTALIRVELNLQSDKRFTLEDVGMHFSGKICALIGNIFLKLLSFSLLSAYVYGLSKLIDSNNIRSVSILIFAVIFAIFVFFSDKILQINRKIFALLLTIVLIFIATRMFSLKFDALANVCYDIKFSRFCAVLPILFTSFGFHVCFHTLTNLCNNDKKMVHRACFFGSLIPASVYTCWTLCAIFTISSTQPDLFKEMVINGIDIDVFVKALCAASNSSIMMSAIKIISILAVLTSIIGVGMALVEDLEMTFRRVNIKKISVNSKKIITSLIALLPPTLTAIFVPKAFINVLSFAGMILSVIAIFLPIFLLSKVKKPLKFKSLENKFIIYSVLLFGVAIVFCECFNLFVVS